MCGHKPTVCKRLLLKPSLVNPLTNCVTSFQSKSSATRRSSWMPFKQPPIAGVRPSVETVPHSPTPRGPLGAKSVTDLAEEDFEGISHPME